MFPAAAPGGESPLRYPPADMLALPIHTIQPQNAQWMAWQRDYVRELEFERARLHGLRRHILLHHAGDAGWILPAFEIDAPWPAALVAMRPFDAQRIRLCIEQARDAGRRLAELRVDLQALHFLITHCANQPRIEDLFPPEFLRDFFPLAVPAPVCFSAELEFVNLRMLHYAPDEIQRLHARTASLSRLEELQGRYKLNWRLGSQTHAANYQALRATSLALLARDLPLLPALPAMRARLALEPPSTRWSNSEGRLSLGAMLWIWQRAAGDTQLGAQSFATDALRCALVSRPHYAREAGAWRRQLVVDLAHAARQCGEEGVISLRLRSTRGSGHLCCIDLDGPQSWYYEKNVGVVRLPPQGIHSACLHFLLAHLMLRGGYVRHEHVTIPRLPDGGVRWHAPGRDDKDRKGK